MIKIYIVKIFAFTFRPRILDDPTATKPYPNPHPNPNRSPTQTLMSAGAPSSGVRRNE